MPSIDFRIDQAAFSDALEAVRRAVPGKASLPILETVRIAASGGAIALSGTDLQVHIAARVAADVAVPGEIAVPARALADWARALPPGTVRLALTAGAARARATSGRSAASLVFQDAEDFPALPDSGDAAELTLDARRLRRALGRVLPAVRGDDSNRALSCVCLDLGADGLRLAAADGFRLAQAVLTETASAPVGRVLIPRRAAEEFARALGAGDVARLRVARNGNVAVLAVGRYEIAARLVEDGFPDVARLIPRGAATRIAVEVQGLRRALKLASFFGTGGRAPVVLDAAPGRLRLHAPDAGTGDCETELEAAFEGRPGRIALDVPLLAELLREATAPVVTLAWEDTARPLVVREIADGGTQPDDLWIVMPLNHAAVAQEAETPLAAAA